MKKEMEEIPDELNPDLMLNTIASELLIKIAKGEIDIQKLVRKQLSDRGAPYIQGDGIRLFTEIPGPSSWEMTGNKCFRSGICRLAYKRIE